MEAFTVRNPSGAPELPLLNQMSHFDSQDVAERGVAPETAPIKSSRLAVKLRRKIIFIDTAELTAVEAQGNYILLRREFSSYRLRGSIASVLEKLTPYGFIRIHRSVLVNPTFVEEIHSRPNGQYRLRVKGARDYRVARTYKENLRSITQLWIGSGNSSWDGLNSNGNGSGDQNEVKFCAKVG